MIITFIRDDKVNDHIIERKGCTQKQFGPVRTVLQLKQMMPKPFAQNELFGLAQNCSVMKMVV